MIKKFLLTAALTGVYIEGCLAFHPSEVRFHCDQDTIKIQELLRKGYDTHETNANKLMLYYGEALAGTPYVAHTLEGDGELLTINVDELDCTTFVETLAALTKTTLGRRISWRDYANNLESIRYRSGSMDGYPSRLHYISEWLLDNSARGNLKEVTNSFPNITYTVKTIDFMSRNSDKYSALKDNADAVEKIKSVEMGFRSHRYPTIKKGALYEKGTKKMLQSGDIIMLVTKIEGLDVSHLGIVKIIDGKPYLLHASQGHGKVEVCADELGEMLRRNRSVIGIRVARVIE